MEPTDTPLFRQLRRLLWACLLLYAAVIVHNFFIYIGTNPYLALDDGLANVSYTLAKEGRLGFLSSPFQAATQLSFRNEHFYNSGPWYYAVGAGLIWLFGYSLELLRSIHLWSILAICLLAVLWFRDRGTRLAGGAFALAMIYHFDLAHWPMVRPDVMVAVFMVLFFIFAGLAAAKGRRLWWFLAGACACAGVLTHMIAWPLAPACAAVCLGVVILDRDNAGARRHTLRSGVEALWWTSAGGLFTLLTFLHAIGYRIGDWVELLTGYRRVHGDSDLGFFPVMFKHLGLSLWPHEAYLAHVLTATALGAVILALLARKDAAMRRLCLQHALAPATVLLFNALSRGTYHNYHMGYGIMFQAAFLWLWAAMGHALILRYLPPERLPGRAFSAVGALALAAAALLAAQAKLHSPGYRMDTLKTWVNIPRYIDEVYASVPPGAWALGSTPLGIENPDRAQLIQYGDVITILERSTTGLRSELAPDFIVWGYPENRNQVLSTIRTSPTANKYVQEAAGASYQLACLIYGAPYGATRVYQRVSAPPAPLALPAVAVFHREDQAVGRWLGPPLDAKFSLAEPVTLTQPGDASRKANATFVTSLPPGDYLIHALLDGASQLPRNAAMVAVTAAAAVDPAIPTELGPTFDSCPLFPGETAAVTLHRALGGPVYVSLFDARPGVQISAIRVHKVSFLTTYNPPRPLPAPATWRAGAEGVTLGAEPDGAVLVQGDGSPMGYQAVSPAVPVAQESEVCVLLDAQVEQGKVALGILDQDDRWITPATRPPGRLCFATGAARSFRVVVSNYNPAGGDNPATRVRIKGAAYTMRPKGLYTDIMVRAAQGGHP